MYQSRANVMFDTKTTSETEKKKQIQKKQKQKQHKTDCFLFRNGLPYNYLDTLVIFANFFQFSRQLIHNKGEIGMCFKNEDNKNNKANNNKLSNMNAITQI